MEREYLPNYMTFNGNLLFHYTKFDSVLKIISTKKLLFGDFLKMNDISESCREVFNELAEDELRKFQSLSFTFDKRSKRAFEIDSLWGYYAEKGNGACLVFDRNRIIKEFNRFAVFHRTIFVILQMLYLLVQRQKKRSLRKSRLSTRTSFSQSH